MPPRFSDFRYWCLKTDLCLIYPYAVSTSSLLYSFTKSSHDCRLFTLEPIPHCVTWIRKNEVPILHGDQCFYVLRKRSNSLLSIPHSRNMAKFWKGYQQLLSLPGAVSKSHPISAFNPVQFRSRPCRLVKSITKSAKQIPPFFACTFPPYPTKETWIYVDRKSCKNIWPGWIKYCADYH